ncbi:chaperonin 10-like protein [Mycena pura]|uniref:Chaperonin 10-like protein n=1 Tax=Mycena pura TaxID=153505 RepID=A0AAD6UR38_9AGAR|nr:chaperonin 10-like protein [Mycena pura]
MKALVTLGDGDIALQDAAVPVISPDEILVNVVVATQNPTDCTYRKTALLHNKPGNILGCDFAGTVVEIGLRVPAGLRTVGERVAGMIHGGVTPNGSFAEYLAVHGALVISIPDDVSFVHAAQLGAACLTSCQALYQSLHLPTPLHPVPADSGETVLIWSGTSATGAYAVQLAKLAGLRVISTASEGNIEFVKALGADAVFDYTDSRAPKLIVEATGNQLRAAMDCISDGMTTVQTVMSMGAEGGTVATLLPYTSRRRDVPVETVFVLAYSIFGKASGAPDSIIDIEFPFKFPANSGHLENAITYCEMLSTILARKALRPIPVRMYPHGLASVRVGFEDMKAGKVHAEKITYVIADTPGVGDRPADI